MKKIFCVVLFFLLAAKGFSQCAEPGDVDFDPFCVDTDAPIDSGVGLLIGAAALYTIKKLRDRNGSTDETTEIL